jgi:hypothetical protein
MTSEWVQSTFHPAEAKPCVSIDSSFQSFEYLTNALPDPPADKPMKYESPPWNVTEDGYLLDIKPHLHDGGVNATFFINGKVSCTSTAVYGTSGSTSINGEKWETISAYTPCPDDIPIKKGDSVSMEAWYDLTKHRL